MRLRSSTGIVVVLLAGTLAGCGGERADPDPGRTVRDSAGVTLVRLRSRPGWDPGEAWRTGAESVLGEAAGEAATVLGHVSDLTVADDGRVFVLDQQARIVRVFGPDGGPAGSMGGPGEGPGELGPLATSIVVRGDTLLVSDWSQARLTRFSTEGEILASESMPVPGGARTWWSSSPSGLYFRALVRFTDERGRWSGRDVLLRYAGRGQADTLLVFQYPESDLGAPSSPNAPLVVNAPSWTVLDDGTVAWLALSEGRVRIHDPDGTLRRILSSELWEPRPPTPSEVEALTDKLGDRIEMLGGSRRALEQLPVEAPAVLPAVTSVMRGPERTLWVQRMGSVSQVHPMAVNTPDPPTGYGGGTWDVLDPGGRYLGSVELPRGLRVMHVGREALYGVATDSLDVERVVRVELRRGGGAGSL